MDIKNLVSVLEQFKLSDGQSEELQRVIYGLEDGRLVDISDVANAAKFVDDHREFAREISNILDKENRREDIISQMEQHESDVFEVVSDKEIDLIGERFEKTLSNNEGYWESYWASLDSVLDEFAKEKAAKIELNDLTSDERKELGSKYVGLIKTHYDNKNIPEAWKYWCKLYDLFEPKDNMSQEEKFDLFVAQQECVSQISDAAVYAITDYGKDKYYREQEIFQDALASVKELVNEFICEELDEDTRTLDVNSERYKEIVEALKNLCDDYFPELSDFVLGATDDDFIFRSAYDNRDYRLYYYNPDSNTHGQIVKCEMDAEQAARILAGKDYMEVLAESNQYLADINTDFFFGDLLDMVEMKHNGLYLGNDVLDACRQIVNETGKGVDALISDASERSDMCNAGKDAVFEIEKD